MEKLKLEHLAPYLPYNLSLICTIDYTEVEMLSLSAKENLLNWYNKADQCDDWGEIDIFKPILRPLSDLDKHITINNETFKPIWKIQPIVRTTINEKLGISSCSGWVPFEMTTTILNKLFEWHFDVFGLIDKELAIDINSLDK